MILGDPMLDTVAFIAICGASALLLVPICQWISYTRDCKKYGKKEADEIWRRMR